MIMQATLDLIVQFYWTWMLRAQEMIIFDAVEWTFQPEDEGQKQNCLTRSEVPR